MPKTPPTPEEYAWDDPMPCATCGQPHARCTAHTRAGKACGQRRIRGGSVCRMHGGSAPQVRAAADARVVEQEARLAVARFGLPRSIRPADALAEEVSRCAGMIDFYEAEIRKLNPEADVDVLFWGKKEQKSRLIGGDDEAAGEGGGGVEVVETKYAAGTIGLLQAWERERDRYAKVSAAAVHADLEGKLSQAEALQVVFSMPAANPGGQPQPIVVDGKPT